MKTKIPKLFCLFFVLAWAALCVVAHAQTPFVMRDASANYVAVNPPPETSPMVDTITISLAEYKELALFKKQNTAQFTRLLAALPNASVNATNRPTADNPAQVTSWTSWLAAAGRLLGLDQKTSELLAGLIVLYVLRYLRNSPSRKYLLANKAGWFQNLMAKISGKPLETTDSIKSLVEAQLPFLMPVIKAQLDMQNKPTTPQQ